MFSKHDFILKIVLEDRQGCYFCFVEKTHTKNGSTERLHLVTEPVDGEVDGVTPRIHAFNHSAKLPPWF